MSLYAGLVTGASALFAQAQVTAMVADNIANISTFGAKAVRPVYRSISPGQSSSESFAPGGVRAQPFREIDSVIAPEITKRITDLCIDGTGFFVVGTADSGTYAFTRQGSFSKDKNGYLRNGFYYLKAWTVNSKGVPTHRNGTLINTNVLSELETVNVSDINGVSKMTQNITIVANLPADAPLGSDEATVDTTIQVFDSLGKAHNVYFIYTKVSNNPLQWQITISTDNPNDAIRKDTALGDKIKLSNPAVAGEAPILMQFDSNGLPFQFDVNNPPNHTLPQLHILWDQTATSAAAQLVTLNFGTPGKADGMTSKAGKFSNTFQSQDGVQFGNFSGISISDEGEITATFDNGEQSKIYKIPLVRFGDPNSLASRSGNVFTSTEASGAFILGSAGSNGMGRILASSLEGSGVDLAVEFINLIKAQRAYSAAVQSIRTTDGMLSKLEEAKH